MVDQATYGYAAIPSTILTSKPIYDPVQKAVYAVNSVNDLLSVIQYDDVATSWTETTTSLSGAASVALSNDGKYLIVPTIETFIDVYRVDADSLATLTETSVNLGFNTVMEFAEPVNTGDVFLSVSTFVLFDLDDDSYVAGTSKFTTAGGGGGIASSLNGDRVFVGGNVITYYDFTENTVVASTIPGPTFPAESMLSSDMAGTRISVNYTDATASEVYTVGATDLTLLGNISADIESIVISHDGNFVYGFDYDVNATDQFQMKVFDLRSPDGSGGFTSASYVIPDAIGGVASVKLSVSGDGNTVFIASSSHLFVWPIP